MVGWSAEELGRYLELYKSFERKGPELIKEKTEKDYMSQLNHVLTTVRGVNKTDVLTLSSNFGVSSDYLQVCQSATNADLTGLETLTSVVETHGRSQHPRLRELSRVRQQKSQKTPIGLRSAFYAAA